MPSWMNIPAVLRQSVDALGGLGSVSLVGASHLGALASFDVNDCSSTGKAPEASARETAYRGSSSQTWYSCSCKDASRSTGW